jgi:Protein of unknown function (DUF3455)
VSGPRAFLRISKRQSTIPLIHLETRAMYRSGTTRALQFIDRKQLATLSVFMLTMAVPATADPGKDLRVARPPVCERIQAPEGSQLAFHAYADGVQIYRWTGTSWVLVAPSAVLYADAGLQGAVGIHYGGPTWQSVSGSKVVGTLIDRCNADPTAIDWFLLGGVSSDGPGIFDGVTFIERINTVGGRAPSYPGNFVGEVVNIAYQAEYFFYRSK